MGRRILLAMLALFAVPCIASAQGTGRIVGRVVSAEGNRPVAGATVVVVGSTRGAITDSAGRYSLTDLTVGIRRVQARRIGFISATQTVTVPANSAARSPVSHRNCSRTFRPPIP
jgi:iron complex outermembrane receptor protein